MLCISVSYVAANQIKLRRRRLEDRELSIVTLYAYVLEIPLNSSNYLYQGNVGGVGSAGSGKGGAGTLAASWGGGLGPGTRGSAPSLALGTAAGTPWGDPIGGQLLQTQSFALLRILNLESFGCCKEHE